MNVKILRAPQKNDEGATNELYVPAELRSPPAENGTPPNSGAGGRSAWRGWRFVALIGGFAVIGALLFGGGLFAGQSTRDSASEVEQKLADQATRDRLEATAALKAQATRLKGQARKQAEEARDEGFASGEDAGYSSGVSDGEAQGYDQGFTEGNIEGYTEGNVDGFNEGTCYDPYTYEYVC